MADVNQHGLGRYIPAAVRRKIRQQSKFGCVICRRGFYQYEHIDPPYETATEHNPDRMCCLCGSCHDAVTRGQLSKAAVLQAYRKLQALSADRAGAPVGPLDFHSGDAEILIGGLRYSPAVRTILRYGRTDYIKVHPSSRQTEPGRISAIFTDDDGKEVLWLEDTEWVGSLSAWDIDVEGPRITVRREKGRIVLELRLDPPGRIVVERLDMRIGDAHILATENTHAVGRYRSDGLLHWAHAGIHMSKSSPAGCAIEITGPSELEQRDQESRMNGAAELATKDRDVVMNGDAGVLIKPLGIAFASSCGGFDLYELAIGPQPLDAVRAVVLSRPEEVSQFISTGKTSVGN